MIIGQHLAPGTSDPQTYYYTPWMPANGDFGRFVFEIIEYNDTGSLGITADLETKTSEQADISAVSKGTIGPVNSGSTPALGIGTFESTFAGVFELVRVRFTIAGSKTEEWVHIRALNISWATN